MGQLADGEAGLVCVHVQLGLAVLHRERLKSVLPHFSPDGLSAWKPA